MYTRTDPTLQMRAKAELELRKRRANGATSFSRDNFTAFKSAVWKRYIHARHLELLDSYLMQVARYIETSGREGIGNLMIEMPPRSGKSQTAARLFPAWVLGRNPELRVIVTSYGDTLSVKHSRFIRGLLRTDVFRACFPGVRLADDSQAKNMWDLAAPHEGGLDAVGKGGPLTGKGAHLIITDDLVKGRAEAESSNQRDRDWEWIQDDLLTRKEPGAAHVAIGTRWHQDDVHGRFKMHEPDLWTVVKMPALAEENDPLGRAVGEALWPERYPKAELELIRRRMGDYSFNAEYQQAPMSREGTLFRRDNFVIVDDDIPVARYARFWDLAMSEKSQADYTVGVKAGITHDGRIVVQDVRRFHEEWDTLPPRIAAVMQADGMNVAQGIEKAFYQARIVQKLLVMPELHRFNVRGYAPEKDKFTRSLPFAARVAERMVYVKRAAWTNDFLDEICGFPNAAHDDQVDAASGVFTMLDKPLTVETRVRQWA